MKKPRKLNTRSIKLGGIEDEKGKRVIQIHAHAENMTAKEAKTLHSRLLEFIVWCDRLA
jgi:hypothetical protein